MKRSFFIITLLCLMFPLTVSAVISRAKVGSVQPGLTEEQVKKILGEPDFIQFNSVYKQLGYRKDVGNVLDCVKQMIMVNFKDGKVVSMTSQPIPSSGGEHPVPKYVPMPPMPIDVYPEQLVMSSGDFQTLVGLIKNAPNDNNRMALIEAGSLNNQFQASQVAIVMALFPNENDRMETLRFMGPHISVYDSTAAIMDQLTAAGNLLEAAVILGE